MSGDKIKRVRAVRKWLEKAEDSYSSHKEINGEINLIMAQAEMQRLNETHKYVSVRHWAMRLFALCVALGVFFALNSSWHMIPWEKAEKEPDLIVIQEVKESSLPAEKMK